jgi:hypothetical protein
VVLRGGCATGLEQQQWNEGTGMAGWLTNLDGDGKMLGAQLACATEIDFEGWTIAGLAPVAGYT